MDWTYLFSTSKYDKKGPTVWEGRQLLTPWSRFASPSPCAAYREQWKEQIGQVDKADQLSVVFPCCHR